MEHQINKVAVLGAGVMGAQLAGHLANAGVPSLLFDRSQEHAQRGLETLTTLKPDPLYRDKNIKLIEPCNYDEHLAKLAEVDWVLEAVAENMEIKHSLYQNIIPHLQPSTIITSNTSGLPLAELAAGTGEFRSRFMISHFFNPPRYMRLLELIKGEHTSDDVFQTIAAFGQNVLGKGIVTAKDTANFIGNRIGIYSVMLTLKTAVEMGLSVEEVDKITGTLIGRAKSATFRTVDVVGLDILAAAAQTAYQRGENDEEREMFVLPDILKTLIEQGRLGQKAKAGFYQKLEDKTILSVNLSNGEYGPQKKVRFDGYRLAKDRHTLAAALPALAYSDDKAGRFFWETLSRMLIYTANRIPEISDDIVNVDKAMRWGYGWQMGPFETWDAIGVQRSITRMQAEGKQVPDWVKAMLDSGRQSFYNIDAGKRYQFVPKTREAAQIPGGDKNIDLKLEKSKGRLIKRDWSASLIDLGDAVLGLEFHSILQPDLNPIDGSIIDMLNQGLDLVEQGEYRAMVLANQAQNFCAGANLALILGFCENRDWDGLEKTVDLIQQTFQRIRFLKAPVVAAPFQLTLGGGFEMIAPAAHRVAAAELYIGAVEMAVGLIPGTGGNLRLLMNLMQNAGERGRLNVYPLVQKAFETIGFAKVATSAEQAKSIGYLLRTDSVVLNPDQLIWNAKQKAIELSRDYTPPVYRDDLILPGVGSRTAIEEVVKTFRAKGAISEHDQKIAKKLAHVLTGGDRAGLTKHVDEQYMLDIEREAFVSLAGEALSQDRIRYMLKKGKPLRN